MRIAIFDDDPGQLRLIEGVLAVMEHDCHGFIDDKLFIRALRRESFDLLVIDSKSPDTLALEMLRWARQNLLDRVPVLYISGRTSEEEIVEALGAGADALMTRPIRTGELRARIHALLRRTYRHARGGTLAVGRYRFDMAGGTVRVDGAPVLLKQREFDLALFMFQNIGRLLSRQHLLEAVWGADVGVSSRSLDTHVCRLRTKLGITPENGCRLTAVYGVGYRLETVPGSPLAADTG